MRPHDIALHQRKTPFSPFRIFLTDGSCHDIRHPELLSVTRTHVMIYSMLPGESLPDLATLVDPLHVVRIEPIVAVEAG